MKQKHLCDTYRFKRKRCLNALYLQQRVRLKFDQTHTIKVMIATLQLIQNQMSDLFCFDCRDAKRKTNLIVEIMCISCHSLLSVCTCRADQRALESCFCSIFNNKNQSEISKGENRVSIACECVIQVEFGCHLKSVIRWHSSN